MNIIIIKLITDDKSQNISVLAMERIFDEIMGVIFLDKNRGKLKSFARNMCYLNTFTLPKTIKYLMMFLYTYINFIKWHQVKHSVKYCLLVRGLYNNKETYFVDSCSSEAELRLMLNRLNGYGTNVQNIYEIYVGEETHE